MMGGRSLDGTLGDPDPKHLSELLKDISDSISGAVGDEYFRRLVGRLAVNLGMDYAFVGELVEAEGELIRTLALYADGAHGDNISYDLAHAPCRNVIDRRTCAYPSGVRTAFPRDDLLRDLGVEGYVGVPLLNLKGKPLGIMAVLKRTPIDNEKFVGAVFDLVAGRTAAEMEREAATNALRRSEARFRDIARASSDWFWEVDENRRFTYISERYRELVGHDPAEALGKTTLEVAEARGYLDVLRQDYDTITPYVQANKPYRDVRVKLRDRDGAVRYRRVSGVPVFDGEGVFRGYRGATSDVTEEVRTEERLRASEERLRQAAELARIGSWVWDAVEERSLYASNSMASLLGVSREEYSARTATAEGSQSFVHPDDRQRYRDHYAALRRGNRIEFEFRVVTGTGEVRYAREIAVPVYDQAGRLIQERGTYQDITELKRAEERLHQAQKMEAVGQLTAGVAHDFNNLLGIILGNMELFQDPSTGEEVKQKIIERTARAAERGGELTHRLLAFSRQQTLNPVALDVNTLVEGMHDLLRRTLGETIEIRVELDPDLWICEADPGQLENAVLNLAINARDAMTSGGILSIVTGNAVFDHGAVAPAEVSPGQYAMLAVTDTGCGMAPEVVARIFEPFFSTKEFGQGTGLGLAMIYGFAKQSRGQVTVSSEEGRGTTFKLYLPRTSGKDLATPDVDAAAEDTLAGSATILVVEDDPDLRTLIVAMLESLGYRTVEAGSGQVALDLLEHSQPVALLLTDVVLPGPLGGRELAERAQIQQPDLPVLYMSGYADNILSHQGRLDEGVQLLQKPFRTADLAQAVAQALRQAAS